MVFKWTALMAAVIFTLAACNDGAPERDAELEELRATAAAQQERIAELEAELETGREAVPEADGETAPPFSEEGLFEQLHETSLPEELGFEPEPGPWRGAPAAVGVEAPSTRELAFAAIRELDLAPDIGTDAWEVAVRVLKDGEDRATVAVLVWGLPDDAVSGFDLRLDAVSTNGGWRMEGAEQRDRCARGVTEEGLCV